MRLILSFLPIVLLSCGDDNPDATSTDAQPSVPDAQTLAIDAQLPDAAPISLTICDLQDALAPNHPQLNSQVSLTGVVVTTEVATKGQEEHTFWVQMPNGCGTAGSRWSGIMIFVEGLKPSVAPGDSLNIDGVFATFFESEEVVATSIVVTGTTTVPAPTLVTPGQVTTLGPDSEAYEGVLIEVRDVGISNDSVLGNDNMLHGDWAVRGAAANDELIISPFFIVYYTYTPVLLTQLSRITGVLDHRFEEARLLPRDCADIETQSCF